MLKISDVVFNFIMKQALLSSNSHEIHLNASIYAFNTTTSWYTRLKSKFNFQATLKFPMGGLKIEGPCTAFFLDLTNMGLNDNHYYPDGSSSIIYQSELLTSIYMVLVSVFTLTYIEL